MRDAERHPLPDQPLRDVRREREPGRGEGRQAVGVEHQRGDHAGHGGQEQLQLLDRVEQRLLVLLQIAVVGQRKALERGQQPGQVADQAAGFAARQLCDIRVLLLRHDRAAGGERVVEGDVGELRRGPDDHFLGDPGQVDRRHREHERSLGGEVARRCAVDGVGRRLREAQLGRDRLRIQPQRRAGQGSRPVRRHRGAPVPVVQPVHVAQERVGVRGQVVGEQHRLGVLQVRAPGHRRVRMRHGLGEQRVDDVADPRADPAGCVAQPHPEERGHLVVARPAGAQLPPSSGPARSTRPRSRAECTSSSSGAGPNAPEATSVSSFSRADSMPASSSPVSSPARCSTRACAIDARRS